MELHITLVKYHFSTDYVIMFNESRYEQIRRALLEYYDEKKWWRIDPHVIFIILAKIGMVANQALFSPLDLY